MLLEAELLSGHHALISRPCMLKTQLLKSLVVTAMASGLRPVVIDNGRAWQPFAETFQGTVYLGHGDQWFKDIPGERPDIVAQLQSDHGLLVLDLEEADSAPGGNFGHLLDSIKSSSRRSFVLLDQAFFNAKYEEYVRQLLGALKDYFLVASGHTESDVLWLKRHVPDLALLKQYHRHEEVSLGTATEAMSHG